MSCYHPLKAFTVGTTPAGKRLMKITPLGVDHLERRTCEERYTPVSYPPRYSPGIQNVTEYVEIPCGKCVGCRIEYSRQWANRCMLEASMHDSNWFVTLTYNEEHVPHSAYVTDLDTGEAADSLTLCKRDFQLFMKRLRKKFPEDDIRFFACGEYGSTTFRPHYHAILFGLHLNDLIPFGRSKDGFQYYLSKSLQEAWSIYNREDGKYYPIGNIMVAEVSWETCAYTARYVMKKLTGSLASFYSDFNIEPEFSLMSRKPGIARLYYEDHRDDIYKFDEIILGTNRGSQKFRPPRYFDRIFDLEEPELCEEIKEKRRKMAEALTEARLSQTGLEREELLELDEAAFTHKIKNLKRSLES